MHILSTPIEYLKGVGPIRSELLKKELTWKCKVELSQGLVKTISWIIKDYKQLKLKDLEYKHIK